MKLNTKSILFSIVLMMPACCLAQKSKIKFRNRLGDSVVIVNTAQKAAHVKLPPVLRGELSGGLKLNSDGWSIFVDKGYLRGGDRFGAINRDKFFHVRLFEFELSEIKHPKEVKANSILPGISFLPGAYILGKINSFYQFKIGYGRRQLIAGKPDPGTISIHWVYLGGFSAGLLKPYYLELLSLGEVKYTEGIETDFVSPGNIKGKAPFGKGLDETKFIPGVYFKTGLHFDFSTKRNGLTALETGISGAYYTQKIVQMVRQDPKQFFFNFYASLQFGKRW
jgi:hypothetical protein